MGWLLLVLAWLATAAVTAVLAERHERDRVVWFALGLLFPVAALVALLLGYPKSHARAGRLAPDVEAALRESRVAATMAGREAMTPDQIAAAGGLPDEVVDREMGALKILGLIRRAGQGAWVLAPRAADALAGGEDEASSPPPADE